MILFFNFFVRNVILKQLINKRFIPIPGTLEDIKSTKYIYDLYFKNIVIMFASQSNYIIMVYIIILNMIMTI